MRFIVTAPQRLTLPLSISLPASKSLSNRALVMQGLCDDVCRLTNLSDCDDTRVMLAAFDPDTSHHTFSTDGARIIDIGAAGTSMRFLTAYFASREGAEVLMTGSERMRQRPIGLLVDALRALGADIDYAETEGFPPLCIHGHQLQGGALTIDGSVSSQYISALLMIAPTLTDGLRLTLSGRITSKPYIEMTLAMLREFGVASTWDHDAQLISIDPQAYQAHDYHVESDWSAASYWYEIAALANSQISPSGITLEGLHSESLQGDSAIVRHFDALTSNSKQTLSLDLTTEPDLAQTLIATCCALGVHFCITGLHTLRIKETDRVAALEQELRKLGYVVTDRNVGTTIEMAWDGARCPALDNPVIATYKDHRMAMAFAPLALVQPDRSIVIDDPAVVSKSYPHFWDDLRKAGFAISEAPS